VGAAARYPMDSIVTPKPPLQILSISEEEEGKVEEE
jgi:hypothetical protein